jgi:hypothetical protein
MDRDTPMLHNPTASHYSKKYAVRCVDTPTESIQYAQSIGPRGLQALPGTVRIEPLHRARCGSRVGPQVFLAGDTVVVHEQGYGAAIVPVRRIGCRCEAAQHLAAHHAGFRSFPKPRRQLLPRVAGPGPLVAELIEAPHGFLVEGFLRPNVIVLGDMS